MPIEPETPGEVTEEQQRAAERFFSADHSKDILMTPEEWDAFTNLLKPDGVIINSTESGVIVRKRSSVLK